LGGTGAGRTGAAAIGCLAATAGGLGAAGRAVGVESTGLGGAGAGRTGAAASG
jgi:hypothetical protein